MFSHENGQLSSNGNNYDGDLKNGKKHGRGVYRWANGAVYEGDYKDDKRHGQGEYRSTDGRVYNGVWNDDRIIEPQQISTHIDIPSGTTYRETLIHPTKQPTGGEITYYRR